MKKLVAVLMMMMMVTLALVACAQDEAGPAEADGDLYISVISKGFQHQFWQTVMAGAEAAADHYGVEIFFDGPESEADIDVQVNMLNMELAKNPDAIALAALSTDAVLSQLQQAYDEGIPVVAFDSGVPGAPAGQVLATASTDNMGAAALAADHMFPVVEAQLAAATADDPAVIIILSQDATSESITGRTQGFAEQMYSLAGGVNSVAITGDLPRINTGDADAAAVLISVVVGASPDLVDMTTAAFGVLTEPNLVGIFCSNEGAANGLLAAITQGAVVPEDVTIVGFDAGHVQKAAVRQEIFMGAITQDPFSIGWYSVSLAVRAIAGEAVSDVDTGAKWWDASNMDEPEIYRLLFD